MLNDFLQQTDFKLAECAYLNNKKVLIIQHITILGMSKVQYIGENTTFFVHERLLSCEKKNEKTICLSLFGGV